MFAIEVTKSFYASHALRLPDGSIEPSHFHDFQVTVKISSSTLDALETIVDFHDIERLLADICTPWHHTDLNAIEPFHSQINPSAERIAEHIGHEVQSRIAGRSFQLAEVRITEAFNCLAIWSPN